MTRPLFNTRLMLYDVATKKTTDVSDAKFDQPAGSVVWAPDSKRLYFGIGDRTYRSVVAYNLTTRQYSTLTKEQMISFGNGGLSKDGSRVAYTMDSASAPADVFVAGADFSAPRKLTNVNPEAADYALGETEVIKWKSSDGSDVEGILVKPVGYEAGQALSAAGRRPWRSDRRAHQRLQAAAFTTADSSGPVGLGGALPEPARQHQLRREVHARQHPRLGRRRLPRHHDRRRRGHQTRHRRSGQARGHGLELRRLHDVLGRVADDALQGGADGRRPVEHPQHVRHDRHPGLHRHVLQQLPRRENAEALRGRSASPTSTR